MKRSTIRKRGEARRLAKAAVALALDEGAADHVLRNLERLQARLQLVPMADILAKLPDDTVTARAKRLGITRQAYYDWVNGKSRPNIKQARRLQKLTGFTVQEIRGRE
jgi:hypothetical protein